MALRRGAGLATLTIVGVVWGVSLPHADASVLGAGGKRGKAAFYQGSCKYSNTGLRGFLTTTVRAPRVRGANIRRGRDRTSVRHRVYWVNVSSGHQTLAVSGWSSWLRATDSQAVTWNGVSAWDADWRGNYRADIRIEWWKNGRLIGWRADRTDSYRFYNEYNRGPIGPISSCARIYQ